MPQHNSSLTWPVVVEDSTKFEVSGLVYMTNYFIRVVSFEDGMESYPVETVITTGEPVMKDDGNVAGRCSVGCGAVWCVDR